MTVEVRDRGMVELAEAESDAVDAEHREVRRIAHGRVDVEPERPLVEVDRRGDIADPERDPSREKPGGHRLVLFTGA